MKNSRWKLDINIGLFSVKMCMHQKCEIVFEAAIKIFIKVAQISRFYFIEIYSFLIRASESSLSLVHYHNPDSFCPISHSAFSTGLRNTRRNKKYKNLCIDRNINDRFICDVSFPARQHFACCRRIFATIANSTQTFIAYT